MSTAVRSLATPTQVLRAVLRGSAACGFTLQPTVGVKYSATGKPSAIRASIDVPVRIDANNRATPEQQAVNHLAAMGDETLAVKVPRVDASGMLSYRLSPSMSAIRIAVLALMCDAGLNVPNTIDDATLQAHMEALEPAPATVTA